MKGLAAVRCLVPVLYAGASEGAGCGEVVPGDDLLLGCGEGCLPLLEATASGKHLATQHHLPNHSA